MNKCRYCQADLAENGTFCPSCGKNNAEETPQEYTPTVAVPPEKLVIPEAKSETAPEAAPEAKAEEAAPAEQAPEQSAAPAEIKEGAKATPGKIALAVGAVVLLIAILAALILSGMGGKAEDDAAASVPVETTAAAVEETAPPATIPADGNPGDETCKGSYTVTDEQMLAAKDLVVASVGGNTLTNAQLQVYYWMEFQTFMSNYGYYAAYMGLDYQLPLDTQLYPEGDLTWQQYFLKCALQNWHLNQSIAIAAENAGMQIAPENQQILDGMEADLQAMADNNGMTLEDLFYRNFGPGTGLAEYKGVQELYMKGAPYYTAETEKFVPTEEELEAFYAEHEAEYAEGGVSKEDLYVNVRHILVGPQGGTADENGVVSYSEEEWEACEAKAQEILDQWLAGDKTEDSFAALANEKSEDGGSNQNGGLYENVYKGQMVEPFETWCFDESRQFGDYGLVKTDYGYHIMYFVKSHPQWKYFAESDWVTEQTNKMTSSLMDANPIEIDYASIVLGDVKLG